MTAAPPPSADAPPVPTPKDALAGLLHEALWDCRRRFPVGGRHGMTIRAAFVRCAIELGTTYLAAVNILEKHGTFGPRIANKWRRTNPRTLERWARLPPGEIDRPPRPPRVEVARERHRSRIRIGGIEAARVWQTAGGWTSAPTHFLPGCFAPGPDVHPDRAAAEARAMSAIQAFVATAWRLNRWHPLHPAQERPTT